MDYTLRRQPDGTVNAQPGDAVEYYGSKGYLPGECWIPVIFWSGQSKDKDNDRVRVRSNRDDITYDIEISRLRHARGGAGWHRLREARLREALEKLLDRETRLAELATREDNESPDYWRGANAMMYVTANSARAALADLDNAEPEA